MPGFAFVAGRLPGHRHCPVALPVSERIWKMWRVRDLAAMSTVTAGGTFFGIGAVAGATGLAVFGLLVAIAAIPYRTRAHHNFWVTCVLRPEDSTVLVEPTHQRFDEDARMLFIRTVR
jgi:hypothetical protein